MKSRFFIALLAVAACAVAFTTGCKTKTTVDPVVTTVDSGTFYLHLHTNIDTNEVEDYGTVYTTSVGRKMSFTMAQLYMSHIQLIKSDGGIYEVPYVIVLKQQQTEQYWIGRVPVGTYKAVRFNVGLDSNIAQSGIIDTTLNHPEMWFTSAAAGGYVYVNLQGSIDTTTNANGTLAQMQPFSYKIGGITPKQQVTMPDHTPAYTITKGASEEAHITIDYAQLFTGLALNNHNNLSVLTLSDNTSPTAITIIDNIPSMFRYEE